MLKILAPFVFAFGVSACVNNDIDQGPLPEDGETLISDESVDLNTVANPRADDDVFDEDVIDGLEDEFEVVHGIDDPARPGCGNLRTTEDGKTDNPCAPQL